MAKVKISARDTQIVAMSLFGKGTDEAIFRTPSRITPRTKAALDDLVRLGCISFQTSGNAYRYKANKTMIGRPISDYPPASESEDFPIVK